MGNARSDCRKGGLLVFREVAHVHGQRRGHECVTVTKDNEKVKKREPTADTKD
jgi:hypothetical protein